MYAIALALNMLLTAIVFAPWVKRRETFSGLVGRWNETECGLKWQFSKFMMPLIDWLVWWEPMHCIKTFYEEKEARRILYGS
jgi:hypothetical protein